MLRNVENVHSTEYMTSSLGAGGTSVSWGVADATRAGPLGSGGFAGGGCSFYPSGLSSPVSIAVVSAIKGT